MKKILSSLVFASLLTNGSIVKADGEAPPPEDPAEVLACLLDYAACLGDGAYEFLCRIRLGLCLAAGDSDPNNHDCSGGANGNQTCPTP